MLMQMVRQLVSGAGRANTVFLLLQLLWYWLMGQFREIPGIIQNAKKEKHKQATNQVLNNNQCKLMVFAALSISCKASSSVNNVSFNYNDASLVAEIYWLVKIASCKFSMHSAGHIGDTFHNIFPDSKIAANFSLSNKWSPQTTISVSKQPYANWANLFQDPSRMWNFWSIMRGCTLSNNLFTWRSCYSW